LQPTWQRPIAGPKTRRFLAAQLDAANQVHTDDAVPGLRRFDRPTLIVWGERDVHFPPEWGERLRADIPGARRLELLPETGHLLMEERPGAGGRADRGLRTG
jgi:pimeloyl-ACP methyl ester carboxylesterase